RGKLAAAEAAGVDSLVGVYHAWHRELCAHEATLPFRVVNFLELVGEALGVERLDLFKQWKMMQDVDRVIADLGVGPEAAGLDVETVREVMVAHILGEQPLPLGGPSRSSSAASGGVPTSGSELLAPVRLVWGGLTRTYRNVREGFLNPCPR